MTHSEILQDSRRVMHTSDCDGEMESLPSRMINDEYLSHFRCSKCGQLVVTGMHTIAHEIEG